MAEALFLETEQKIENLKETGKRRLNASGMLKISGVSRSGYRSRKNRLPSDRELRKQKIKEKITKIHNDPHQNYGA